MSTQKPRKKRLSTPLLLQTHITECGAACLGSVLAYFGRWEQLTDLRAKCEVSRDGSSAAGIMRAARSYGLECEGRSIQNIEDLKEMSLPLILFWEFNHFLILEGFDENRFFLNDPSSGRRTLTAEKFSQSFTGVALKFTPTENFKPGGSRPKIMNQFSLWLDGVGNALIHTILSGLMLAILMLVIPAALMVFVDGVLGENEPWSGLIAGILVAAAVLSYQLNLLKQRWLKRLAARMSIIAGNQCISQMLRLPVEFFSHRIVGDLIARVLSIDRIAKGVSEQFLGLLIEFTMSLIFLAVMLAYAPILALIVLALAVSNAVLTYVITRIRLDMSLATRREQGLLIGVSTSMLNQTDTLRMTAADDHFFSRWAGHQARALFARQNVAEIGHINASLPGLFTVLGHTAVLTLGALQVMAGEITLGMLAGFFILASMFLAPVGRFIEFASERQTIETDMQRLQDIMSPLNALETDVSSTSEVIFTLNGHLQLTGHVELRDVTFGYNRSRPPLIKDFNLIIEPGQRVAVVGASGSGKSTLAHLLSGLYQPWSGKVMFDGHLRQEIPHEILSRSISMVSQQVSLFSANIRDNITLWNPSVPDETVVAAARDACIHNEILHRPHGYATLVDEDGTNFSGGQKQRLEIARALASNPVILILDEATSALDATTEVQIDDALRRRGVSCLIIAHRLSTIRDCDQIIVLDKGEEVQRGTHDELMKEESGLYFRLVRTDSHDERN